MTEEEPVRDRRRVVIAGLVVALVAAVGVAAWLGWELRRDRQEAAAGQEAEDAAREMLLDITTYSHESVEEDFAWLEDYGTDGFQQGYSEQAQAIEDAVATYEVVATGSVEEIAHRTVDADQVVVLAFVDQVADYTATGESVAEEQRVRLTLLRDGGDWVIDDLQLYSGQNALPEQPSPSGG